MKRFKGRIGFLKEGYGGLALVFLSMLLVCGLMAGNSAQAVSPEAEEKQLKEICQELVCLCGCGNMILDTCTCGRASEWKNFLRGLIKQGKTKEQMLRIMADRHGEQVLAAPPKEGLNWVLWVVVPYVVPILGAIGLIFVLLKWVKKRKVEQPEEEVIVSKEQEQEKSEYEKKLEDELKDFEE